MAIHPLSPAQPASAPITTDAPTTPSCPPSGVTTGVPLTIPLDGQPSGAKARRAAAAAAAALTNHRDSMKRREALLRGKEGTRRRQRWENDRLLSNPHAVPPSAADWEPRPLHPKRHVPYEYATLWDSPAFQKRQQRNSQSKPHETVDKVPKELKARLKRSHAAVDLLHALEEEVRKFVLGAHDEQEISNEAIDRPESLVHVDIEDIEDESDEEIVFISKKMRYQLKRQESEMVSSVLSVVDDRATEKVLFESLLSDPSASFGRWLVHSIAAYYGLKSWSVTTGNPAKRLAYVGLKKDSNSVPASAVSRGIPKPLYLMV